MASILVPPPLASEPMELAELIGQLRHEVLELRREVDESRRYVGDRRAQRARAVHRAEQLEAEVEKSQEFIVCAGEAQPTATLCNQVGCAALTHPTRTSSLNPSPRRRQKKSSSERWLEGGSVESVNGLERSIHLIARLKIRDVVFRPLEVPVLASRRAGENIHGNVVDDGRAKIEHIRAVQPSAILDQIDPGREAVGRPPFRENRIEHGIVVVVAG